MNTCICHLTYYHPEMEAKERTESCRMLARLNIHSSNFNPLFDTIQINCRGVSYVDMFIPI